MSTLKRPKFSDFIKEETTSADIASVDTKLDLVKREPKHLSKGKRCKKHKELNCEICENEEDNLYQ